MSTSSSAPCAVVTGGAGALGSAVALELSRRGFPIALLDAQRSAERLGNVSREIETEIRGARVHPYPVELATADGWAGLVERIEVELGPIANATLVAGAWRGGAPLHAVADDSTWRAMIDSNLETVHRSLRAILPAMVARKSGAIVVIGSRNVERPWSGANAAAYTASKAAVVALAQAVAAEVLESGVRINAILPSTLDTPANRAAMPDVDPAIWVSTESAAKVIAFLLSEDAKDVSGAAIPVYGRA